MKVTKTDKKIIKEIARIIAKEENKKPKEIEDEIKKGILLMKGCKYLKTSRFVI